MRHKRSKDCIACGPFIEDSVMIEFEDADQDVATICVNCLIGILGSIDMPEDVIRAWMTAWASETLDTDVSAVSNDQS